MDEQLLELGVPPQPTQSYVTTFPTPHAHDDRGGQAERGRLLRPGYDGTKVISPEGVKQVRRGTLGHTGVHCRDTIRISAAQSC